MCKCGMSRGFTSEVLKQNTHRDADVHWNTYMEWKVLLGRVSCSQDPLVCVFVTAVMSI
jgi:hypothetical protein